MSEKFGREIVKAAQREVERMGCLLVLGHQGQKSRHYWIVNGERREPLRCAITPSDKRAMQAVIAEVRRACRRLLEPAPS